MGMQALTFPGRLLPLVFVSAVLVGVYIFTGFHEQGALLKPVRSIFSNNDASGSSSEDSVDDNAYDPDEWRAPFAKQPSFTQPPPGIPKPAGSNYSVMMVVPRTRDEDIAWMTEEVPEIPTAVYVADDEFAPLHPPLNKGREVMNYLTYIIEHYDALPEIVLFMHAHKFTYHNNDLHGGSAVPMLKALNYDRVVREGYVNLRCHWDPGCPAQIRPFDQTPGVYHLEDVMIQAWVELFPDDPIPDTIAQPCCAQFAVTRETIRARPLAQWVAYRTWLLHTKLTDYYSGRVWEYAWQYVFTAKPVLCPPEHVCYCDGYGLCFGGDAAYRQYLALQKRRDDFRAEQGEWRKKAEDIEANGPTYENGTAREVPEPGGDRLLDQKITAVESEMDEMKKAALARGQDPRNRALEAGREWKEGDGF